MKILAVLTVIAGCWLLPGVARGQNVSCAERLRQALDEYDIGRIEEIPEELVECLENGFNKQEEIDSYKLLTLVYLYQNKPEKAEETYLEMLSLNPEVVVDPETEPIELVYFDRLFRKHSLFSVGARVGVNTNNYSLINRNTFSNAADLADAGSFNSTVNFSFAADFLLRLKKELSLYTGFGYMTRNYDYAYEAYGFSEIFVEETSNYVEVPLALHYRLFPNSKLQPYVYAGYMGQLTLSAGLSLERNALLPEGETAQRPATGPEIDVSSKRNDILHFAMAGAGLRYKIGLGYLKADLRYLNGLNYTTDPAATYSSENSLALNSTYGYLEPDFQTNSIVISAGYIHPFYFPKRYNEKQLRRRKISLQD